MEYKDYYKILGVPKGASDKEIKAAYRKLARRHHPDVNPGSKQAEARFKQVNEAYEVLSDPEKRRRYEELGQNWAAFGGGVPGAGGWPGGGRVRVNVGGLGGASDFSDFFRTFFGGGGTGGSGWQGDLFGGGAPTAQGSDLEQPVELTLEEVHAGATRTIAIGGGRRRVEVRIPAGVRDGSLVRVAGEGGPGAGRAGDLYLRVKVLPHATFERRGDDLVASVSVPLTTAVLGGEASVPTFEGPVGIRVPPGTPVGRTFRLKGKGLPRLDGGGSRGDILATLGVRLPGTLSRRERELYEELRKLGG